MTSLAGVLVQRTASGLAAAMIIALPASSAAQTVPPIRPTTPPVERWFDQVPVSGGMRVGIMVAGDPGHLPAAFSALLPQPTPAALCVQITSKDGRYEGKFRFELGADVAGTARLAWDSEYLDALTQYSATDIAVLAQAGDDCANPDGPYVVTSWLEAPEQGDATVLLNSDDPTSLVLVRDGAVVEESGCTALAGVARAFNLTCSLPQAWMGVDGSSIFVRVRERAGRRIRIRDLALTVAAG